MDTSSTTVATTTDNPLTTLRRGHSSPRSRRSLETPRRRIRSPRPTTPALGPRSRRALNLRRMIWKMCRWKHLARRRSRTSIPALHEIFARTLDRFYLHDNGDRETVRLLMRGMPIPCTYGLPNTDGGILSNAREFTYLFHPLVSYSRSTRYVPSRPRSASSSSSVR